MFASPLDQCTGYRLISTKGDHFVHPWMVFLFRQHLVLTPGVSSFQWPLICFAHAAYHGVLNWDCIFFAVGNLLPNIRAYTPDSFIMVAPLCPKLEDVLSLSFLSSSSTCIITALLVSAYPSASATSLPTNHGSPSITSTNTGYTTISQKRVIANKLICCRDLRP